jgi:sortase A
VQAQPPSSVIEPSSSPAIQDLAFDKAILPDPTLSASSSAFSHPVRIIIPRLTIDLPVVQAPLVNGHWALSETSASHGIGSASPGEAGNIVIFAHARPSLFYSLKIIRPQDTVYLHTSSRWFAYRVATISEVFPDQIEVISPTTTETLTLFTCSGFADSKRLIVTALPHN